MADLDLTDREEFERAIAAAQADIATSIDRAGLRDDPYRYPLAALSTALGLFPHFLRHIDSAAGSSGAPIDAAVLKRLEAGLAGFAAKMEGELPRVVRQSVWTASGRVLDRLHIQRLLVPVGTFIAGVLLTLLVLKGMFYFEIGTQHFCPGTIDVARDGRPYCVYWMRS